MRSNYGTGGDPANRGERTSEEPAQSMTSNGRSYKWVPEAPNGGDTSWVADRPSPTVVGSFRPDVVAAPGYRKAGDGPRQNQPGSVSVSVSEAALLQSFPADHRFVGSKSQAFLMVGNACPPLMMRAIYAALLGLDDLSQTL